MADRSIKIVMSANVTGLVNGFKTAQTAAKNLNQTLVQNEQAARDVTTGLGLIGAAAVAGAGYAIKTFATFDKQMSNVKATGAATATELTRLREAAVEAGAQTAFSATEAAAGIENLLKAGVSATDVLGGGLAGSLNLAAAGGVEVAQAAEIAATAMTQFNLSGKDVTHVADLLAAGAGKAAGDVTQISQALNQAGLVASQTGLSIEETTGTLAAFASAGLLGSDAGTSFKTMLQRLSAPTKENAKYMEELGISAYDAQGQFVGMEALAGQLTAALGEMTPAQRNAALATIFGADAVRAASVVYDQGAAGIDKWVSAVDDQGYAAKTAAARLDNLQGDLEALGGAFESTFIKAGGGGNDILRGLTQGTTDLVNAIGRIDPSVLSGLTITLGAGGGLALAAAGIGKVAIGVNNATTAMQELGVITDATSAKVGRGMRGAARAIGVASAAFGVFAIAAQVAGSGMDDIADSTRIQNQFEGLAEGSLAAKANLEEMFTVAGSSGADLKGLDTALRALDQNGFVQFLDSAGSLFGVFDSETGLARESVKQFDAALAAAVQSGATEDIAAALDYYKSAATDAGVETSKAMGWLTQYSETSDAASVAQNGLTDATGGTTGALGDQTAVLEEQIKAQQEAIDAILGMRDAHRGLESAIDDAKGALKENGKTLDVGTEKGRQNQAALDGIAESGLKYVQSLRDQNASQGKVNDALGRTRKSFIETATSMGMPIGKARDLADSLGLIKDKKITVDADTAPARKKSESAAEYIDRLKGTITADGDTAPARKKGESAKAYIDRLRSTIEVKADTGPAEIKVDEFISKARKTIVKIGTSFLGGFGPQGDGEGAGWSGSTPRGVSQMSKAVQSLDPGARITSGYRPGAVTATGFPSYHGMGRAIDIVSPNKGRTFDLLKRAFGSRAKELYYTPRGFIRNGRPTNDVAAVTRATHYSHVHLALANGGGVRGRGTGTSDEIPAWLSNGEHVLTAAEVRKLGGQQAVYRLRGAIQAGRFNNLDSEATFAKGGAVGSAESELRAARRALARARKSKKGVDRAQERYDNARERLSTLTSERTEFGRGVRRGDLISSATSDASGAYSVIDDMLGLARSGNLTKRQSRTLTAQAAKAEAAVRGLYKEVDKVDKRLESAADNTERLQGISDGVKNALMGEQSLSSLVQEGAFRDVTRTNSRGETWTEQMWDAGGTTAKGLVGAKNAQGSRLKSFASKLNQLRAKGLSGTILEEIGNLGATEGMQVADALLKEPGQIDDLNRAYKDVAKYAGLSGEYVTDAFSKGGLSAAKSFEKGLVNQKSSLEKQAYNWGVYMANGLSAALTGKKTGLKKRARGGPVAAGTPYLVGEEGAELVVPQASGYVMTAQQTRYLATTAHAARSTATAGAGGTSVNFQIENITATNENAAVDRMTTKAWDSINTHGINGLAQGVGV